MTENYIISFERASHYQRFLVTQVMSNIQRGMVSIDLVEEVTPGVEKFIISPDGNIDTIRPPISLSNLVHSTMIIPFDQLPSIISSLQSFYDNNKPDSQHYGGE